jgi:hypothetical protein
MRSHSSSERHASKNQPRWPNGVERAMSLSCETASHALARSAPEVRAVSRLRLIASILARMARAGLARY